MNNALPDKGKILVQLSNFWFEKLHHIIPNHLATVNFNDMPNEVRQHYPKLRNRCVVVRRLKMLPVEAIVRGYIAGSGWKEYQKQGSVCGIVLPPGLQENQKLSTPIFTPSTKAALGQHDENITMEDAKKLLGVTLAKKVEETSIHLYEEAAKFAEERGILIADTKFEFGVDEKEVLYLADEVLTPDSSRFWPKDAHVLGRPQPSFDKQYVRDYLDSIHFDRKNGITLPETVMEQTREKYVEVFTRLTKQAPQLE